MIDRRTTIATLAGSLIVPPPLARARAPLTAREVFTAIKAASGQSRQ